jgi:hypothetical protein
MSVAGAVSAISGGEFACSDFFLVRAGVFISS